MYGAELKEERTADSEAFFERFQKGEENRAYEYFGVHKDKSEKSYVFRVYFPKADRVEISGDLNSWGATNMINLGNGIWEKRIRSEVPLDGTCYKYRAYISDKCVSISDVFSAYAEKGSGGASIVYFGEYVWRDSEWMVKRADSRKEKKSFSNPINIYQLHLGTWRTRDGRRCTDRDSCLNYRDIAAELVGYVSDMGYTHISLISVTDPEGVNIFAPLSCHGRPDDFKYFIDTMHLGGIGVILECKSVHDEDYSALAKEIRSVNISNVLYWIREYHVDGICLDERSLTYADSLSKVIKSEALDTLLIFSGVTEVKETEYGNMFDLCYSDLWRTAVFDYAGSDPQYKKYKYGVLNKSLTAGFGSSLILPVTWLDVSDGKRSLAEKMYGDREESFARLRLFYSYMMTHPGKKLTFMGCEIGETAEWNGRDPIDWFLLECEANLRLKSFVKQLNSIYLKNPSLWQNDVSWRGFEWITPLDDNSGIMAYKRIDLSGKTVVSAMNFTENRERVIEMGSLLEKNIKLIINSDDKSFGGRGRGGILPPNNNGQRLTVPPLSAILVSLD